MHDNSVLIFQQFVQHLIKPEMLVLEVGPDKYPSTFQKMMNHDIQRWHAVDIQVLASSTGMILARTENSFPINSTTYDVVFNAQVIEHVRQPWLWMQELARVVKVGGMVITIGPVSWPYHEAPIDVGRYYPEGMRAIYQQAGLAVLRSSLHQLEYIGKGKAIPGRSLAWVHDPQLRQLYEQNMEIGGPVETSIDCLTIGQK
jgi:SAM-dependent methyltransferase